MLTHKETLLLLIVAPWLMALLWHVSGSAALPPTPTPEPELAIGSPHPGEALQGEVTITGMTDLPGFRSAEISFAYPSDPTGTWFLITQSSQPVKEGSLATWDTTTISDGGYRLRVQVFLADGRVLEKTVEGLRVRNYTVIETSTPETHPAGRPTETPTGTPRPDFQPGKGVSSAPGNAQGSASATPLPTNPAQVTPRQLSQSALQGILWVLGASLVAALYVGLRAIPRR